MKERRNQSSYKKEETLVNLFEWLKAMTAYPCIFDTEDIITLCSFLKRVNGQEMDHKVLGYLAKYILEVLGINGFVHGDEYYREANFTYEGFVFYVAREIKPTYTIYKLGRDDSPEFPAPNIMCMKKYKVHSFRNPVFYEVMEALKGNARLPLYIRTGDGKEVPVSHAQVSDGKITICGEGERTGKDGKG